MPPSKPTLVLVHGAWHSPKHFVSLTEDLESHGYKIVAVDLPTMDEARQPPADLNDDTAVVRDAVLSELNDDANVVVIAHSYGGGPTNNSLKDLDHQTRNAAGHTTSVTGVIFVCALPIPAGMTLIESFAEHDIQPLCAPGDMPNAVEAFYNDVPAEESAKWTALLRLQSIGAYTTKSTSAAYMVIPSFYLYTTDDRAIPIDRQKSLVNGAINKGAKITAETMESAHSPWLSHLDETSKYLRRCIGAE